MRYYWVTAQAEYSTDVLFRRRADLEELMPRLCQYATLYFGASDVLTFLGRKLTGHFLGEAVTELAPIPWTLGLSGHRPIAEVSFDPVR